MIENLNLFKQLELPMLLDIIKRELPMLRIVHRIHLRLQNSAGSLELSSIFEAMPEQRKIKYKSEANNTMRYPGNTIFAIIK